MATDRSPVSGIYQGVSEHFVLKVDEFESEKNIQAWGYEQIWQGTNCDG